MPERDKLKIGVCGIGSIGYRHARLLSYRPDVDLYLCDTMRQNLEQANGLTNVCKTTDCYKNLLEWSLDGVVIATPQQFHVSQSIEACRAKTPVLVEKPLAESVEQGKQLLEVANQTGIPVLVGYCLRYAHVMQRAKALLDDGVIGNPISFQIMLGSYESLTFAKSRFSNDDRDVLILDYSHEWDYINWMLGTARCVVATSSHCGDLELSQHPNVAQCILTLDSGISGTVHIDYVQLPGRRRITVIGDRGTLDIDVTQCCLSVHDRNEQSPRQFPCSEHRDAYLQRQLDHFILVIGRQATPGVTVEDGLHATAVAESIIISYKRGTWQKVSELSSTKD